MKDTGRIVWPASQVGHGKSDSAPGRIWMSGPPPHVGWWNAVRGEPGGKPNCWRWWNGYCWSFGITDGSLIENVAAAASNSWADGDSDIVWSDYWPENAVVPRINPDRKRPVWWNNALWEIKDGRIVVVDPLTLYGATRLAEAKAVRSISDDYNQKMDDVVVGSFLRNATTGQLVAELLRRHG